MNGIKKEFAIMCAKESLSQAEAARQLNQTIQVLNKKLVNESMRYNEAEQIADHFGYDIIWIKRKE